MLSTLSASGVFSSCVDYFCLVCESRLRDEADAAAHVAKPVHTKNFLTTEYFGNEEECVRKVSVHRIRRLSCCVRARVCVMVCSVVDKEVVSVRVVQRAAGDCGRRAAARGGGAARGAAGGARAAAAGGPRARLRQRAARRQRVEWHRRGHVRHLQHRVRRRTHS